MPETLPATLQLSRTGPKTIGAAEFLTALFGPYYAHAHKGYIEIRLIGERHVKSYFFKGLGPFTKRRFTSKRTHIFYGLLPREERIGKKEATQWLVCLWADLDAKNFSNGKEDAWKRLREFELVPSAVVDSGHGLQVIWCLNEPFKIVDPQAIEDILFGLAKALQGDTSVCELARVFRLPESFNIKEAENPLPVKVRFFNPWQRYSLSEFTRFKLTRPSLPNEKASIGIEAEKWEGLEKVMDCKFVRYSKAYARDLPEPLWWSLLSNLLPFMGGRTRAHELSKAYRKGRNHYSFEETERKIRHILNTSPGPHTCRKIVEYGYPCSSIGTCPVEAPAGLAWAEQEFVKGLSNESYEIKGEIQS